MSSALSWGGFVLFILSLVALIRGKVWFIKSRPRALLWLSVSVIAFVIGAIAAPKPVDEMEAAARQARANAADARASQSQKQAAAATAEPSKPDLEVLETHSVSEGFARYVAGTVKNNSGRKYGYAQVEINLYDKDGNQVGSTLANVNNLEPGATWKFKAIILEDSATSFKVKGVTGF